VPSKGPEAAWAWSFSKAFFSFSSFSSGSGVRAQSWFSGVHARSWLERVSDLFSAEPSNVSELTEMHRVAPARKLACVLHRMWVDGTSFRFGQEVAA
jgi:hypothetical protein